MIFISMVSIWIIPLIIFFILLIATWKKVPTYELFVEGGKEGIDISLSILPFLLGMLVSIAILQSSGALTAFVDLFTRSEEHTSELQSRFDLVCRLLLEKKK